MMSNDKESNAQRGNGNYFFRASPSDFKKIPGQPLVYWASQVFIYSFECHSRLTDIAKPMIGMRTGDNERFLRFWHEISKEKMNCSAVDSSTAKLSGAKWFPYNKGGEFRRWYGNNFIVVNWEDDGIQIKEETLRRYPQLSWDNLGWKISNERFFYQPSITWTATSSGSFGVRYSPSGFIFDVKGSSAFPDSDNIYAVLGLLASKPAGEILKMLNPTLENQPRDVGNIPYPFSEPCFDKDKINESTVPKLVSLARSDWDSYENSWNFISPPLLNTDYRQSTLNSTYQKHRIHWREMTRDMQVLEEENNRIFINAYGLQDELTPEVSLEEITLTCNPHYRYDGNRSEDELETLLQCDTLKELVSYAIGCMMGRYSLDKPGLILASQGETIRDYLAQIPEPSFAPDENAIIPLTDQEWFPEDATNRFRDFVRIAWGEEHLQENLNFVAESLCLHAIKPKKGEASLDTTRRYLSTQFYKDHLRTYKKRPIYWLFSSGKQKAFECLVYLHRYNESTLAEIRTDYVIPLTEKLASYVEKLEQDKEASASAAEAKRIEKELSKLYKQQAELNAFDEKLRHYADQRISLDLDDGVKVNYGKFGDLLAEVKQITGK